MNRADGGNGPIRFGAVYRKVSKTPSPTLSPLWDRRCYWDCAATCRPRWSKDFRGTGTPHLLAISGLHVGVLVVMFLAASAWLFGGRGFYFLAVPLIAVWAYALVSGMPPSVVRAAMMGSGYLVAVGIGRPGSILPALVLSAGLMTVISREIVQRVSFQFSFAAMAGDALTQPFIPRWSPESTAPGRSWWAPLALPMVRAPLMMLIISWSAMLATWPLLAFNFR